MGGKTAISNPKNTIPDPKPQKKTLVFVDDRSRGPPHGQPQKGTATLHDSKSGGNNTYCCSDNDVLLARAGEGGHFPK